MSEDASGPKDSNSQKNSGRAPICFHLLPAAPLQEDTCWWRGAAVRETRYLKHVS